MPLANDLVSWRKQGSSGILFAHIICRKENYFYYDHYIYIYVCVCVTLSIKFRCNNKVIILYLLFKKWFYRKSRFMLVYVWYYLYINYITQLDFSKIQLLSLFLSILYLVYLTLYLDSLRIRSIDLCKTIHMMHVLGKQGSIESLCNLTICLCNVTICSL